MVTPNYKQYGFGQQYNQAPLINRMAQKRTGSPSLPNEWRKARGNLGLGMPYGEGPETILYQHMQKGSGPGQGLIPNIMQEFPADMSPRKMKQWFDDMAPLLATSLFQSPSYKFMQDPQNWDDSMGAYGAGAGMLGQSAANAQRGGQTQLSRMGLGRSGAQAALAGQTQQALGNQQSNLYSNLYQQSIGNRLTGARNAFDLDRSIMGMATGMGPGRTKEGGGLGALGGLAGPAAGAAGNALGGLFGSMFGGGGGSGAAAPPGATPGASPAAYSGQGT